MALLGLQNNPAIAMERFLDQMPASGAAEEPIAPAASVSGGNKAPRRGIGLAIVLSGRQPSAPLVSPSPSARAAMNVMNELAAAWRGGSSTQMCHALTG